MVGFFLVLCNKTLIFILTHKEVMQYFMNASSTAPLVSNNLIVPLRESRRQAPADDIYTITLTCDISKVSKEFVPVLAYDSNRYSRLRFRLVNDISDEDLNSDKVFFEPTGSYTWVVKSSSDSYVHARGKAIVYPYGTFSTETKFGNEVTYTEHLNPTTNTIYIQA